MPKLFESTSLRAGDRVHFSLTLAERDAICLNCPLADCVGDDCRDCPLQIEQRRRWREIDARRKAGGYFEIREARIKAKREARRELVNA